MASLALPDSMTLQQPQRPPVSSADFRASMSTMGATVCVATAKLGEEMVGRTITAVLSLTISPPTILVSIDIDSRLAEIIAKSRGFSFAMLADDQQEIAEAFAGRLDLADRFQAGEWTYWPSGEPKLLGAASTLDCEVIGSIETGTHVLFAGAVIAAETNAARAPLLWQRHHYHRLEGFD